MFFKKRKCIYLLFFIYLSFRQVVYAAEANAKDILMSANDAWNYIGGYNYTLILNITIKWLGNTIKFLLGVFTIEALGLIINAFRGQKSDIESVSMELLIQKPVNEEEYAVWQCDKIFYRKKEIEKSELWSPYSLLITIKRGNTERRKIIHTIVFRKLIIEADNYTLIYIPEKTKRYNYKKGRVGIDNDKCCLLLEPAKAKVTNCNERLDIFSFFNKPDQVKMYIEFFDFSNLFSLCNYLFPKTRMILFEKKNCFQGELRIEIYNKKILKRKYENEKIE